MTNAAPNAAAGFYPAAVVAMGMLLAGTLEPTPLFELYRRTFNLGPGEISAVFAAYAASLVPGLLFLGGVSDALGRRLTIVVAFAGLLAGAVIFACADGLWWLVVARVVQGGAMAIGLGAAAAAIREWMPAGGGGRAGFWTVIGASAGSAFGALLGGVLGEYAPYPLVTPYLVYGVLLLIASAIVWRVPAATPARGSRHAGTALPPSIRRQFILASAQSFVGWAGFALFIALVPAFLAQALDLHNLLVGAFVITGVQIGSSAGSLYGARFSNRAAILVAMSALGFGVWLLIIGVQLHLYVAVGIATLIVGAGGGISYLAGLNIVNGIAPPEHRAETLSAFLVACYLGFSLPALGVGIAANVYGLFAAFAGAAIVLGAIAATIMAFTTDRNVRV